MGTRWLTYAGLRLCNLTMNQGKAFVRRGYHEISYQPQSNDNLQSRLKWQLMCTSQNVHPRETTQLRLYITYRLAIQTLLKKSRISPAKPNDKNILREDTYTLQKSIETPTQGEIVSHIGILTSAVPSISQCVTPWQVTYALFLYGFPPERTHYKHLSNNIIIYTYR